MRRQTVMEAWLRVKSNGGSAGVDGQSIKVFEEKLKDNLYKIWNRMSSGSYFPSPVLLCEIPKPDGKTRTLGIPTVADRVAQMVAKKYLEPQVEPIFHPDSYGYRPNKSAHEAIGVTRQRCWKYNWVIDLDIRAFFDTINHELMMRAVRKHTTEKWVLLYIERWLKASGQDKEGRTVARDKGTPQGGVISPLLANIFLHHAFDRWMREEFADLPFERYADDIIVHCYTEKQAQYVLERIRRRLQQCGLALHPDKTRIVYCKDVVRKDAAEHTSFDFLGYTFRQRKCRNKYGKFFVGFTPAVSRKAQKSMSHTIRHWQLNRVTTLSLKELSEQINPVVRGWMNYYGAYCRSALHSIVRQIELAIAHWAIRKYKKLHRRIVAATRWLRGIWRREPHLFAHWAVYQTKV
jgi:RNA-directed DNA polymerase